MDEQTRSSGDHNASMVSVTVGSGRVRGVPHAFPVLAGRVAAVPGSQAALDRSRVSLDRQGFTGKTGQVAALDSGDIAVGVGEEASADTLRTAAGGLARSLGSVSRITTSLHEVAVDGATRAVVEGLILGGYAFANYKSKKPSSVTVELIGADAKDLQRAVVVAEAEVFARNLVNTPAADKAPQVLASLMVEHAGAAGVSSEVWSRERLAAERVSGVLAVSAGSERPPCLVRLSYRPRRSRGTLALVGKGIVFDSGGLSIKSAENMETMKTDMSGAAAVAASVAAIARLRIPLTVEAYLPITDNMPGGAATRPGDVITYRNGKTIEVLNTDAEGRLVLADGLILAAEEQPDLIVDIATLTGAMRIALGDRVGGVFGTDSGDVDLVRGAGAFCGERFWEMPLVDDYSRLVESEIADMKNTGGRYGGSIAAALILREFTAGRRWVHLDIAGPARADRAYWWFTKGGTGFGTRTLIRLAELMGGGR